jgi:sugar-specific transcriptional regulator TrmB
MGDKTAYLSTRSPALEGEREFGLLGIDEAEEAAYRALLRRHSATQAEMAQLIPGSPREIEALLDRIAAKGLATVSPKQPRQFIAIPPDFAVESLITKQRAKLEQVRHIIPGLVEQSLKEDALPPDRRGVELITSRAALGEILLRIRKTTQFESLGFQRAPILFPQATDPNIAAGVRVRSISDTEYVTQRGAMDALRADIERGEEARVYPVLPSKMHIADRRIGIMPLNADDPSGPTLLIQATALLNALCMLFDLLWEKSTPLMFGTSVGAEHQSDPHRVSVVGESLIPLLATGRNDKEIAHAQSISEATLTRRISELMRALNARTRFQLGWQAALRASAADVAAKPATGKNRSG